MGQISVLLWSWIETTRSMARGRLWAPILVFTAVQWLGLLVITQFHQPILAPVLVPLFRSIFGDAILHYPNFYLGLYDIYGTVSIILDLLLWSWLQGAAFLAVWQADRPAEPGRGVFLRSRGAYGKLLIVRFCLDGLLILLLVFGRRLLLPPGQEVTGGSMRMFRYGSILIGSILESLLVYAPLAILIEKHGAFSAIRRSLGLAWKAPIATFLVVFTPNLLQIPAGAIFRRSDSIVINMSPEVVGWLMAVWILVYGVSLFYLVGAATRIFRVRTEAADA
jgi:hypothetical protein